MGYYTYFTLDISPYGERKITQDEYSLLETEIDKMQVFDYGDVFGGYGGEAKWYDHDYDMQLLSLRFQNILFELHGNGESEDDKWNAYYLNGRVQFCPADITYPAFDPATLLSSFPIEDDGTQRYSCQSPDSQVYQPSPPAFPIDGLL